MPDPQPAWCQQYDRAMHPVWERRRNELIVDISEANTMLTFAKEIQAPVGVVWDHLTDPAKRREGRLQERN